MSANKFCATRFDSGSPFGPWYCECDHGHDGEHAVPALGVSESNPLPPGRPSFLWLVFLAALCALAVGALVAGAM